MTSQDAQEPATRREVRGTQATPLDIPALRETTAAAAELLADGAPLPRADALGLTRAALHDGLGALIPHVETLARLLPEGEVSRVGALLAAAEARRRVAADAGSGLASATAHARRLAQALHELCGCHDRLAATMPGAYRLLLDHTQDCGTCAGAGCAVGGQLRRAWRDARGAAPCAKR